MRQGEEYRMTTHEAGVLHRAKNYFLDEDVTAGEDGQHALRDAAARTKLTNGFKVDTAGPCEFFDAKLARVGSPTGNFWFTIETSSGGVPSGTVLGTSNKYDVSRLPITPVLVRLPFSTPPSLSAATQYHLVLQGDFTLSSANHLAWRADTTAAAYANGSKGAYDGATWANDADDDFIFKIYITQNDVAVTMPTGYTQKAKIAPWLYNNSVSNFKQCRQKDRTVFCGYDPEWKAASVTAVRALVDLFELIPPSPVVLTCMVFNATGSQVMLGQLSSTDVLSTAGTEIVGAVEVSCAANSTVTTPPMPLTAYQGMMVDVNVGTGKIYIASFMW
jgi:hypothetical protein